VILYADHDIMNALSDLKFNSFEENNTIHLVFGIAYINMTKKFA
jgi:hypothetical protein